MALLPHGNTAQVLSWAHGLIYSLAGPNRSGAALPAPLHAFLARPLPVQWPLDRVLYLAASAESGSEHPLARALLAYAAQRLDSGSAAVAAALLHVDQQQREDPAELGDASTPGSPTAGQATDAALQAPLLATQAAPTLRDHSAAAQQEAAAQQLRRSGGLAHINASEALPGRGLKCWLACPAERLRGLPQALLGDGAAAIRTPSFASSETIAAEIAAAEAGAELPGPDTPHAAEVPPMHRSGRQSSQQSRDGGRQSGVASSATVARSSLPAPAAAPAPSSSPDTAVQVRLAIGNRRLMQEEGVALSPRVRLLPLLCCGQLHILLLRLLGRQPLSGVLLPVWLISHSSFVEVGWPPGSVLSDALHASATSWLNPPYPPTHPHTRYTTGCGGMSRREPPVCWWLWPCPALRCGWPPHWPSQTL